MSPARGVIVGEVEDMGAATGDGTGTRDDTGAETVDGQGTVTGIKGVLWNGR